MKKCALILARGGSKGIPRKNLQELEGKTLLEHVIHAAKTAKAVDDCDLYVSTDDPEIASVATTAGAKVIDRPAALAGDLSTDLQAMLHFLHACPETYDYIVHLRASFPRIKGHDIDRACEQFEDAYDGYDSLRSVVRTHHLPYKMWHIDDNGYLTPVVPGNEMHSMPRQLIPVAYEQNAAVDLIKCWILANLRSVTGDRIMPFLMNDNAGIDIDTLIDLNKVREKNV